MSLKPRQMAVTRDGHGVIIEIRCGDEYEAMLLYDKAVACACRGRLRLNIDLVASAHPDSPEGGAADV